MGALAEEVPVLVRLPEVFNDPYAPAMMAELQHRNIPFVIEQSVAPQLGDRRVDDGRARAEVTFGFGPEAEPPPGGREVTRYRSVAVFLTPRQPSELGDP